MILAHELPIGISTLIRHESLTDEALAKGISRLTEKLRNAHHKRVREWISARLALQEAFRHFGVAIDPMSIPMKGHHALEGLPDWRFTISHDDTCSTVWLAKASGAANMGVDVEEATREVKDSVRERIESPKDAPLSSVELWSLKEAIFKSLPEAEQSGLPFRCIGVLPGGRFSIEGTACEGQWIQKRAETSIVSYAWRSS